MLFQIYSQLSRRGLTHFQKYMFHQSRHQRKIHKRLQWPQPQRRKQKQLAGSYETIPNQTKFERLSNQWPYSFCANGSTENKAQIVWWRQTVIRCRWRFCQSLKRKVSSELVRLRTPWYYNFCSRLFAACANLRDCIVPRSTRTHGRLADNLSQR